MDKQRGWFNEWKLSRRMTFNRPYKWVKWIHLADSFNTAIQTTPNQGFMSVWSKPTTVPATRILFFDHFPQDKRHMTQLPKKNIKCAQAGNKNSRMHRGQKKFWSWRHRISKVIVLSTKLIRPSETIKKIFLGLFKHFRRWEKWQTIHPLFTGSLLDLKLEFNQVCTQCLPIVGTEGHMILEPP